MKKKVKMIKHVVMRILTFMFLINIISFLACTCKGYDDNNWGPMLQSNCSYISNIDKLVPGSYIGCKFGNWLGKHKE